MATSNTDWRFNKNLTQCNRYMFEKELECDVTFKVGPEGESSIIRAHKFILMGRSQVFFSMLTGPMMERSGNIAIPDIDPEIFKKMLLYMYCDDTRIELDEAFDLLYAANKYSIYGLTKRCIQKVRNGMSSQNVCMILQQAYAFDDEETKTLCLQYIFHHSETTFSSNGFTELSADCLKLILRHHKVNLKEEKIFSAVLLWADKECMRQRKEPTGPNKREVLGDILDFIRFPRMDPAFFTDKVSHMGILNQEELVTNFRFFLTQRAEPPDPPRDQRVVMERFHAVLSGKGYMRNNSDAITFISDKDTKLHEVLIYGSCQHEGTYQITLKIKEDGERDLHEKRLNLTTDGHTKTYPINIDPPLRIAKRKCYTIDMLMRGPVSYYGNNGSELITQEEVTLTIIPNARGLNGTTVKQGQFHGFVFEKLPNNIY